MYYNCSKDFLSEVSQRVARQKWVCVTELRRREKDLVSLSWVLR